MQQLVCSLNSANSPIIMAIGGKAGQNLEKGQRMTGGRVPADCKLGFRAPFNRQAVLKAARHRER